MLSVFDNAPHVPCPAPFNLSAHVLQCADRQPDKPALEVLGPQGAQIWTYRQLQAAVLGTATGLLREGFKPGDIVVMRLGNSVEFPIAYLGAIAAGIVPVPTSSQLTEAEVANIFADLSPAGVLHDPAVACSAHPRTVTLDALIAMRDLPPVAFDMGDPDRMAYVVYTSGTSGVPRAVAHAHRAIWARQMMIRDWYALGPDDRLCHAGAFNWTYTLGTGLMDPWTVGATALIPIPGTEPTALPSLLQQNRATIFAAAPGVYRKLLNDGGMLTLPTLRHGLCAGEKLSEALHKAWEIASGRPLFEAYGMSECSTFISACPDRPAQNNTLGQPQAGRRVAILGPGGPVPRGSEGTIAVHRSDPGLMLGYLNAPEETEARFQGDWFLTGDQGVMDDNDQIAYLGRSDDMMNAGGYRVSPVEVEAVLNAHPDITLAAVTDVEVKADTRVIAAFYTAPAPLDENALSTYVHHRLAHYKTPRAYVHLPELPTGANGKLLRRVLRDRFEANRP
ncbi:MAG: class I adenylate-forming enzyme family protein [Paracoccaceae bacterium]